MDPITLGILGGTALLGAGGATNWFGMGGKKEEKQNDPLANIRDQLLGLASNVPELVSRQKEMIGQQFGAARKAGLINVGEDIHARRGMGATTLEDRLRTELLDKLARGQATSELEAEKWGLGMQASLLGQAGGMMPQPEEEEPAWWESMLGMGGQLAGQQLGIAGLKDIFKEEAPTSKPELLNRPTAYSNVLPEEIGSYRGFRYA